jgi:protein TIF31
MPLDSLSLTKAFHQRGINMRYLGKFYEMIQSEESDHFVFLKVLVAEEMIIRSCKKILRSMLSTCSRITQTTGVISNFLNSLMDPQSEMPIATEGEMRALRSLVLEEIHRRFLVQLPNSVLEHSLTRRKYPVIRALCLCMGIQLEMNDFEFLSVDGQGGKMFLPSHIVNMVPVVKSAAPKAHFADEVYEHGRLSLAQGHKEMALELLQESVVIYEQTNSMIHPETARVYASMASLLFQLKNVPAALEYQQKCVIAFERTLGIDHPETLQQYVSFILSINIKLNLAYFENANENSAVSLRLMKKALACLSALDPNRQHPDHTGADVSQDDVH